jgi:ribonuclease BN (tRNA processing enzyme)
MGSYLVDAGTGVVRQVNGACMAGTPALKVEGLNIAFITHLHNDHTLGLPDLIFTPWVIGRTVPLELYGPTGIAAMVSNILKAGTLVDSHPLAAGRVIKGGVCVRSGNG